MFVPFLIEIGGLIITMRKNRLFKSISPLHPPPPECPFDADYRFLDWNVPRPRQEGGDLRKKFTKKSPVAKLISESPLYGPTCNVTNKGTCSLGRPSSVPTLA